MSDNNKTVEKKAVVFGIIWLTLLVASIAGVYFGYNRDSADTMLFCAIAAGFLIGVPVGDVSSRWIPAASILGLAASAWVANNEYRPTRWNDRQTLVINYDVTQDCSLGQLGGTFFYPCPLSPNFIGLFAVFALAACTTALLAWFAFRRGERSTARMDYQRAQLKIARDPATSVDELRRLAATTSDLAVMRALSQNPRLPVELQAALMVSISNASKGPQRVYGYTWDIDG